MHAEQTHNDQEHGLRMPWMRMNVYRPATIVNGLHSVNVHLYGCRQAFDQHDNARKSHMLTSVTCHCVNRNCTSMGTRLDHSARQSTAFPEHFAQPAVAHPLASLGEP